MSLFVDNTVRKHIKLLISSTSQVLVDFCKLALEFIKNGPNVKKYKIAAQKLETEVEVIENAVTGLVKLLVDASKHSISVEDFGETVLQLGFNKEQKEVLEQCYSARQDTIRGALGQLGCSLPSYRDLQWRLEAQVASRSVPSDIQTNAVLDLQLDTTTSHIDNELSEKKNSENVKHIAVQCDLPGLVHLTAQLETALRESKTFHIRRMQRVLEQ